jgi:hypothetical protein
MPASGQKPKAVSSTPASAQRLNAASGTPAASPIAIGERVVYRALEESAFAKLYSVPDVPLADPDDAENHATVQNDGVIIWHQPGKRAGFRCPDVPRGTACHPVRFLNDRLVIQVTPRYAALPEMVFADRRPFVFLRRDAEFNVPETGIDTTANTRILGARVARTVNGDSAQHRVALLCVYATRTFEGEETKLRVRIYDFTPQWRSLDGPGKDVDLAAVAYVDQAAQALVMVTGEVWDIAKGRTIGRIKGIGTPWYVESTGHFYALEAGSTLHPWGVVDAQSEGIVAGGTGGRELILSRLEIDSLWTAHRVEVARVVVPAEGEPSAEETKKVHDRMFDRLHRGELVMPQLEFGAMENKVAWSDHVLAPDGVTFQKRERRHDVFVESSRWTFVPSPAGPVAFIGCTKTSTQELSLMLLVDPRRPKSPVALNYRNSRAGFGIVEALGTFPASPDSTRLGFRFIVPASARGGIGYSGLGRGGFVLDRGTGAIGPWPTTSWRVQGAAAR